MAPWCQFVEKQKFNSDQIDERGQTAKCIAANVMQHQIYSQIDQRKPTQS